MCSELHKPASRLTGWWVGRRMLVEVSVGGVGGNELTATTIAQ